MQRQIRRGLATATIIILIIVVAGAAVAGYMLSDRGDDSAAREASDLFAVRRGGFDITVPASGELAALDQVEVSSQLDARAVITWIVDEGQLVKKGDLLIRLDDEDILAKVKDAELAVNNAEASLATAQSNKKIREDSARSQFSLAEVDVKLAQLDIRAWTEGDDVSRRRELELNLETTRMEYDRLVARQEASKALLEQEFISQDEFDQDEIRTVRAKSDFQQAELAMQVYLEITREQEIEKLQAALKKAQDQRDEIEQRNANEIRSLEVEVANREVALARERERLERAQRQADACTILAPQDGLVVYATSLQTGRMGRNDNPPPQIGTELPRNRPVIVLPDTSQMVAEVKVNEALSGKIESGQKAVVVSDAVPDASIDGEVMSVGVLAETGGWRDPNRRDYTVRLGLAGGNDLGLKPSMRCKADIYIARVDDALFVPVQAVFRDGARAYVYTPRGSLYAERTVRLGRSSELFIEILEGLEEGESVLLRQPAPDRIVGGTKAAEGEKGAGASPDDNSMYGPPGGPPEGMSGRDGTRRPDGQSRDPGAGDPPGEGAPSAAPQPDGQGSPRGQGGTDARRRGGGRMSPNGETGPRGQDSPPRQRGAGGGGDGGGGGAGGGTGRPSPGG